MAVSEEFLGFALNVSQRLAIRTSLNKLRINEKHPSITFWGKILGTTRDYYVAQGAAVADKITKTFYFSADEGVTFSKLPDIDEFIEQKVVHAKGMFTGNPANLYKDPNAPKVEEEEEEPEPEEGDEEEKAPDPSKRKLTELERLAHTVHCIDTDTCVVPRGAFILTPTGVIQKNKQFEGFPSRGELSSLSNYLLFRDPQSEHTLKRIRKLGVTNNPDFLDGVTEDQPAGVWVTQVDEGCTGVRMRSLLWPGYEFKMESGTPTFVGAYFGHGLKNEDVMFML